LVAGRFWLSLSFFFFFFLFVAINIYLPDTLPPPPPPLFVDVDLKNGSARGSVLIYLHICSVQTNIQYGTGTVLVVVFFSIKIYKTQRPQVSCKERYFEVCTLLDPDPGRAKMTHKNGKN
jgi:hypothetical protein